MRGYVSESLISSLGRIEASVPLRPKRTERSSLLCSDSHMGSVNGNHEALRRSSPSCLTLRPTLY